MYETHRRAIARERIRRFPLHAVRIGVVQPGPLTTNIAVVLDEQATFVWPISDLYAMAVRAETNVVLVLQEVGWRDVLR